MQTSAHRRTERLVIGRFEELDWQSTPMGDLTLRRRTDGELGVEIFEVKLGEEFLMSSLFTVAEEELATLGLAAATGDQLDVLVGGLGLGYTAIAALRDPRVRAMTVIDTMPAVRKYAWVTRSPARYMLQPSGNGTASNQGRRRSYSARGNAARS